VGAEGWRGVVWEVALKHHYVKRQSLETHTKSPEGMLQNVPLQNQIEHIQHAAHIIIIIIIITIRRFCLQLNLWLVTFGDLSFRSELIHPPKGGCSYCVY
jgi:hypothetical protein